MKFKLTIAAQTGREHADYLRRMIPKARVGMRSRLEELSISLVGKREMSRLHQQFMGIAGPTDVLTFELEDSGREGEIVICVPVAKKAARQRGIAVRDELLLYAIHGMLHLSGWDDRNTASYKAMHRKEDQILRKLGVGAVFTPLKKRGKT